MRTSCYLLVALALSTNFAQAEAISLPVLADGWAASGDNFASIDFINTNANSLFVILDGGLEERAAFEFDISSLPSNPGDIISASLVVYITEADDTVGVHGGAGDGVITDSDFTFANQFTTFNPESSPAGLENIVDVTSFIQSSVGNDPIVVLQLRELIDPDYNEIHSSEFFDEARRPRLDVVFIPESASLVLLLLSGISLMRRRPLKT